jgi:hypothetical protein
VAETVDYRNAEIATGVKKPIGGGGLASNISGPRTSEWAVDVVNVDLGELEAF